MEPIRSEPQRGLDRNKRRRASNTGESGAGGFAARLDEVEAEEAAVLTDEELVSIDDLPEVSAPTERLYDAVHESGQRLLRERTYTAAQRYRETIRRFLRKVVPDVGGVVVHESNRDIMSRKRYYLLTTVNRSVDRLIQGILQSQHEQLEILQRLEEIEGMLVDLMQ